jgi:hypothetical protein
MGVREIKGLSITALVCFNYTGHLFSAVNVKTAVPSYKISCQRTPAFSFMLLLNFYIFCGLTSYGAWSLSVLQSLWALEYDVEMMLTSPADSINLGDTAGCKITQKPLESARYTRERTWTVEPFCVWYSHTRWFPHVSKKKSVMNISTPPPRTSSSCFVFVFVFLLVYFISLCLVLVYNLDASKLKCLILCMVYYVL